MFIFYVGAVIILVMTIMFIVVGIASFFEPTDDNLSDDELPSYMSVKDL